MKNYLLDRVTRLRVGMSRPRWEDLNGQVKISRNHSVTPTGLIITCARENEILLDASKAI